MRLAELEHGSITTIEIDVSTSGPPLDVPAETSVCLQEVEGSGEILIGRGLSVSAIAGREPHDRHELQRILGADRERIVWLPRSSMHDGAQRAMLQVHEFAGGVHWTEPVALAVDDRLLENLKKSRRLRASAQIADALRWLDGCFLLPDAQAAPNRAACATIEYGERAADASVFSLHGRGVTADVKRDPGGRLLVTRVRPLSRTASDAASALHLMRGELGFADATLAGQLAAPAAAELDDLIKRSDSYLQLWGMYNEIERAHRVAHAQRMGALRYERRRALGAGTWRLHLARGYDRARVKAFGEDRRASFAAASTLPDVLRPDAFQPSSPQIDALAPQRNADEFLGEVVDVDLDDGHLDLRDAAERYEGESPPENGYLFVSLFGDYTSLERRSNANRKIVSASGPMPQLGLLIEGRKPLHVRRALHKKVPPAVLRCFPHDPTPRQREALLTAMNTPDIAVIQGPPGTGKTEVIAALEVWLAEAADSGGAISKSVLLTSYQHDAVDNAAARSRVLDLPAVRVGGRGGTPNPRTESLHWAKALAQRLPSATSDGPLIDAVGALRRDVLTYMSEPFPPERTADLLEKLASAPGPSIVSASLRDRMLARASELRGIERRGSGEDADARWWRRLVRALRTSEEAFADDGPMQARKLLAGMRTREDAEGADLELLAQAGAVTEADPELLARLTALRERLLEQSYGPGDPFGPPIHDELARDLLKQAAVEAEERIRDSREGVTQVIAQLIEDLNNDPHAVTRAITSYTAVLAATCQQSASAVMAREKDNQIEFDTVIVDEAARANPLDLMIPLSHARRRIVLVGDQRQLPHVLEPDVEAELDGDVSEQTRETLRRSLFERLFEDFRRQELDGGPKRVVTLDTQFRMPAVLGDFVSRAFYEPHGTTLRSDPERPQSDFRVELTVPAEDPLDEPSRLAAATWIDVPRSYGAELGGKSKSRPAEVRWIAEHLPALMEQEPHLSFGVITFYNAQLDAIQAALAKRDVMTRADNGELEIAERWRVGSDERGRRIDRLRVGTVDAFQGREFDVVLLSLTRSSRPRRGPRELIERYGHLMLENRLCVAMSRQRRMLIVVGDREMASASAAERAVPGLVEFERLCTEVADVRVLS